MKKKLLKRMLAIQPSDEILAKAAADVPVWEKNWRGKECDHYQYDYYMSCKISDGILMAAFFPVRSLRLGGLKPIYGVFIDKGARKFITWDENYEKWRNSKLDRLEWSGCGYAGKVYVSEQDNEQMKAFLGVSQNGYRGILEFQEDIRWAQLQKRHKKETDPWDAVMGQVPSCPDDWNAWVDKYGIPQNYIFYEYSRKKKKEGYCSWCEKKVPIENPRHNQEGTCPCCGNKIQFKAIGKMAGYFQTERKEVHLVQRCGNGIVVRMFEARRIYRKESYENPELVCNEERRIVYDSGLKAMPFYYGRYKNITFRWIQGVKVRYGPFGYYYRVDYTGRVYPKTLPDLENKELKCTGFGEMLRWKGEIEPEKYLNAWRRIPVLEQLVKAGLNHMAEDIIAGNFNLKVSEGAELAKRLGIDKMRMKRLRKQNGGCSLFEWLQYEKQNGICFPDTVYQYFVQNQITPAEIGFIEDRMSLVQIMNYLVRQEKLADRKPKEMLSTWTDYLFMAERLHMDVQWSRIYRPKNLVESHDEAVKRCGGVGIIKRAREILKAYPDVERIYASIKEKYEYTDKKYQIVVPKTVEEILVEGKELGHCLSWSDVYFSRIQWKESFIVFLRNKKNPEKSYYTLEIEPDGTARQKRTVGDNQNSDLEAAMGFIRKWQRNLQKKLTEEDILLAKESARLRAEELKELREKKARINHGYLKGQYLADILEADLMEAARCAKEDEPVKEEETAKEKELSGALPKAA